MPKRASQNSYIACRDCKRPLSLIQQPDAKGGYIPLITCWNPTCLLHGVTLSVELYQNLTEEQLEAYREMNRISRPRYNNRDDT